MSLPVRALRPNSLRLSYSTPVDSSVIPYLALVFVRKNEELCDAILEVEGRFIHCHRVVLAAAIPYFKAMFTSSNMSETNKKTISIKVVEC